MELREYKDKQLTLKGSTVLDGFPCVGLAGAIAASYLIWSLELDCIAVLDSANFPPLSMIYGKKPKFPARIHASPYHRVAVFTAEFTAPLSLDRTLAKTMLRWSRRNECSNLITTMGMFRVEEEPAQEPQLIGVGSNETARARLEAAGIEQLDVGMVAGIPAVLLNEGKWEDFDVIALLVQVHPGVPDFRAGARVVQAVNRILPKMRLDIKPLLAQAEEIERRLKAMRSQARVIEPETAPIYR